MDFWVSIRPGTASHNTTPDKEKGGREMLAIFGVLIATGLAVFTVPSSYARRLFLTGSSLLLLITLAALRPGMALNWMWWPALGLNLHLAVTPYNLPLLWLNAIVLMGTGWAMRADNKGQAILMTVAAAGVDLAFLAQNLLLYFLGFELAVLPFFVMLRRDGAAQRRQAAHYFLGFSAVAGVFLLAGILIAMSHGVSEFGAAHLTGAVQLTLYAVLLVTWAVKTPLWPLHVWLPRAHGEAPTPVSMYLSGVALKVAPYGFLVASASMPEAMRQMAPGLALWGAVNVLIGTVLALVQRDLKQTVALSSIASMGYVMIALAWGTALGREVAILVMVGHGLVSPLLFWCSHRIEALAGSRQLDDLPGLWAKDGGVVRWLTLGALSYMGLPGLAMFPGEFGVLLAAWHASPFALWIVLPAMLLTAAVWIRVLARARFGAPSTPPDAPEAFGPRWPFYWLGIPLLALGLFPHMLTILWHWGALS